MINVHAPRIIRVPFALVVWLTVTAGQAQETSKKGKPGIQENTQQELAPEQQERIAAWFRKVGPRRSKESFGDLVARAARLQIGKPYHVKPPKNEPEHLRVRLETFHCVSLVEMSLALARCSWLGTQDVPCFLAEIEASRYRAGKMTDYVSRLHYFADWLTDNAARGRVLQLAPPLAALPAKRAFFYMSKHPKAYPAMGDADVARGIAAHEQRLSEQTFQFVPKAQIRHVQKSLQDGDILAIVGDTPGIVVKHTGLVAKAYDPRRGQTPRVLHASRHHGRVLLTAATVAGYVEARRDRKGLLIARPLPPAAIDRPPPTPAEADGAPSNPTRSALGTEAL